MFDEVKAWKFDNTLPMMGPALVYRAMLKFVKFIEYFCSD